MTTTTKAPAMTTPEQVNEAALSEGERILRAQRAEIDKLKAALAAMTAQKAKREVPLTVAASDKGVVVVRGVPGAMALSAEAGGWLKVLEHAEEIRAFCEANKASLDAKRAAWKASDGYKASVEARKADWAAHKAAEGK